jgi:hypothetical protein
MNVESIKEFGIDENSNPILKMVCYFNGKKHTFTCYED